LAILEYFTVTLHNSFRACWGFSAGAKNEGFFRQFSRF
jgi:hypothetical protein